MFGTYKGGAYEAVDGRVYEPDSKDVVDFEGVEDALLCRRPMGMSLKQVYRIELFLAGAPYDDETNVPGKEATRLKAEYPMLKQAGPHDIYQGDETAVWEVLKAKFPLATAGYRNYTEALYAMQYGAEPIPWALDNASKKEGLSHG